MSSHKYADLPYIDTAQDIYETEDIFPGTQDAKSDESEDEGALPQRGATRVRNDAPGKEEIDSSNLIDPDEASRRFKKAERKHDRSRTYYAYPPSPTEPFPPEAPVNTRPLPLSQRLRTLQTELASLEAELADPSNPQLAKEREVDNVDPGELIRGLVDVRGRLEKIRKGKEGRGKLVGAVLGDNWEAGAGDETAKKKGLDEEKVQEEIAAKPQTRTIIEIDRRVGELEKVVGSSSAVLDETSPLPPPLLPLISRLNAQVTLLTQPRHIDSISRRLKLLLSDLERVSAAQHHAHRRHPSESNGATPQTSQIQEQILPLLTRLGPSLPHIPHILARLRTLGSLHTSAVEFQESLKSLEQEQQKMREALNDLQEAVNKVEASLEGNRGVVRGNVSGLESRVDSLLSRLEELNRPGPS